jgi:hypothetical protein
MDASSLRDAMELVLSDSNEVANSLAWNQDIDNTHRILGTHGAIIPQRGLWTNIIKRDFKTRCQQPVLHS